MLSSVTWEDEKNKPRAPFSEATEAAAEAAHLQVGRSVAAAAAAAEGEQAGRLERVSGTDG